MKCSRKIITSLLLALNVCLVGVGRAYWTFFVSKEYGNDEITLGDVEGDREVCYLDSDTEGKRFTSIEAALATANKNGSGTVYVYPKAENSVLQPIYIKRDCVIKSGVTLTLPYSGTKYDSEKDDSDLNSHPKELIMADSSTSNVQKYRVTQVIMNEGVTLTVESGGHLNVGGFLWARYTKLAGQTAGNYAEISLCKKASIVCNGGEIKVFGYIKEYDVLNNSSYIDLKSGTLLCPLVIYDYQGGAATTGVLNINKKTNKLTPFSCFDLCNIQTKMIVNSAAFLKVKTALYVDGLRGLAANFYPTGSEERVVTMIGNSTSKTILQLTSGTIEMKYTPAVKGITSTGYDSTKTLFSIQGTVTLGGFSLDVSGKKLNTEDCFFPISWRLGFELEKGSEVTFNKKIKFMTGSTLRIKNGASLTISNNCNFYQSFEDNEKIPYPYPSNLPASKLICNGDLAVTSTGIFGGLISTEENTGAISYQSKVFSSSSPETTGKAPSAVAAFFGKEFSTRNITTNAQYVSNSSNAVTNFSSTGTYKSQGNYFVKE